MHKYLAFAFLLWVILATQGCASKVIQKQLSERQVNQDARLEQQQFLMETQQVSLEQLQLNSEYLRELLEVNQAQLSQILVLSRETQEVPEQKPKKNNSGKVTNTVPTSSVPAPQKMTLGRVEWVWVAKLEDYFKARVDTGANSSSIHASEIQYFERDGKQWVRFNMYSHESTEKKLSVTNEGETQKSFEAPVVRTVKIKQATNAKLDKRPVIKLRVRLGNHEDDVEFTLTDRTNMLYPILLGRNFIQDVAVVDISQAFVHKRLKKVEE
jgi:hypothetical protein